MTRRAFLLLLAAFVVPSRRWYLRRRVSPLFEVSDPLYRGLRFAELGRQEPKRGRS